MALHPRTVGLPSLSLRAAHTEQDDGSRVLPSTFPSLEAVAALLEIEPEALERALTVKSVGKFPVIQVSPKDIHLSATDSESCRE